MNGCGPACFHKDTVIAYKDQLLTLDLMLKNPQHSLWPCTIPHIVTSDGLKITTSCKSSLPLKLTVDHLVWSPHGYILAQSLEVGDFLYQDEVNKCQIINIDKELNQEYFGLNCEESDVLANGFKTSTFGVFHTIPALWMKYVSKLFGVKKASAIGDFFVNWISYFLRKMKQVAFLETPIRSIENCVTY